MDGGKKYFVKIYILVLLMELFMKICLRSCLRIKIMPNILLEDTCDLSKLLIRKCI